MDEQTISTSYFIVYPNTQSNIPELELIELQGELETRPSLETKTFFAIHRLNS